MEHPEEDMILDDDEEKMMMLLIKRKFIVHECGYLSEEVDPWKY